MTYALLLIVTLASQSVYYLMVEEMQVGEVGQGCLRFLLDFAISPFIIQLPSIYKNIQLE